MRREPIGDPGRLEISGRHDAAHRLRQLRVAVRTTSYDTAADPVARARVAGGRRARRSRSPGRGRGAGPRTPLRRDGVVERHLGLDLRALAAVGGALAGQVEAQLARPAGIGRDAEQPARQEAPAGRNNPRRHSQQRRVDDGDAVRRAGPADRDAQPDREQGDDQIATARARLLRGFPDGDRGSLRARPAFARGALIGSRLAARARTGS